jgi:hypothetical protein
VGDLLRALVPLPFAVYLASGFVLARIMGRIVPENPFRDRLGAVLLSSWMLLPPIFFYVTSVLGGPQIFVERLFGWNAPALALALAALLLTIAPVENRLLAVAAAALLLLVREEGRVWRGEDWRRVAAVSTAVERAEPMPILAFTGLIESEDMRWLERTANKPYLSAPFEYYPTDAKPLLIPSSFASPTTLDYLHRVIEPALQGQKQFLLIALRIKRPAPDGSWAPAPELLARFFKSRGYEIHPLEGGGQVELARCVRVQARGLSVR